MMNTTPIIGKVMSYSDTWCIVDATWREDPDMHGVRIAHFLWNSRKIDDDPEIDTGCMLHGGSAA